MSNETTAPPVVEDITDADVQRAEQEAAEAVALVDALESRVIDGDETVTHDQIEQARSLGRFARLRVAATARKAEAARKAARLRTLEELAEQMRARHSDAAKVVDLMVQLEAAATGLIELCAQRTADFTTWRRVMHELDVPKDGAPVPAAEHGRVGWLESGTVLVDGREMRHVQPAEFIGAALHRVIRAASDPLYFGGKSIAEGLPYVDDATLADLDTYRAYLERNL